MNAPRTRTCPHCGAIDRESFYASTPLRQRVYDWVRLNPEMPSKMIADYCGISPEAIRWNIKRLNVELAPFGAHIRGISGSGYTLIVHQPTAREPNKEQP